MTQKPTASQILAQLEKLHTEKPDIKRGYPYKNLPATQDSFYAEVKTGKSRPGHFRLDAVAFRKSWLNPCITGYEIKISRADFLRDNKWQNYQKYCHEFWFVCPVVGVDGNPVINVDELPGDVGLIYYSVEHDSLFVKRRAMRREIDMRSAEVVGMLYYIALYRCS